MARFQVVFLLSLFYGVQSHKCSGCLCFKKAKVFTCHDVRADIINTALTSLQLKWVEKISIRSLEGTGSIDLSVFQDEITFPALFVVDVKGKNCLKSLNKNSTGGASHKQNTVFNFFQEAM